MVVGVAENLVMLGGWGIWSFYRALFPYTPEMDTEISVVMFFVVTPVPFIHIPCV